jgi:protein SCO1
MKKYNVWLFVAAVVLLPMGVFAVVKWYEHGYTKLPVFGGQNHTIADFQLVDQHNFFKKLG